MVDKRDRMIDRNWELAVLDSVPLEVRLRGEGAGWSHFRFKRKGWK